MEAKNQEVLLRVENLCQYFGPTKAVDGVSFDIKKGEVFGLVGESGCGKTTTGRSIIKIYDITSGNIYFENQRICAGTGSYKLAIENAKAEAKKELKELDEDSKKNPSNAEVNNRKKAEIKAELDKTIAKNKAQIKSAVFDHKNCDKEYSKKLVSEVNERYKKAMAEAGNDSAKLAELKKKYKDELRVAKNTRLITKIQMIFQDPIASLNPRMTVREIIAEGLVINGIRDKEYIDEKVYEILEMVGLVREHAGRYPHEFSGGQRQRIGIARSVIMRPDLLIADEPISALDVSIRAQVLNLLNQLKASRGLTYLFIAHDLSIVRFISDRIGVIYKGNIVEVAEAEELFNYPLHPYTHSLISAIPIPDPQLEKNKVLYTYDPSIHDYSEDKPEFVCIGHDHYVYGNKKEIEEYKAIREKGEPMKTIRIVYGTQYFPSSFRLSVLSQR